MSASSTLPPSSLSQSAESGPDSLQFVLDAVDQIRVVAAWVAVIGDALAPISDTADAALCLVNVHGEILRLSERLQAGHDALRGVA